MQFQLITKINNVKSKRKILSIADRIFRLRTFFIKGTLSSIWVRDFLTLVRREEFLYSITNRQVPRRLEDRLWRLHGLKDIRSPHSLRGCT